MANRRGKGGSRYIFPFLGLQKSLKMVTAPMILENDYLDPASIPGSGRSLEKETAMHFSIFAWKIPWTEELARLQSMRL